MHIMDSLSLICIQNTAVVCCSLLQRFGFQHTYYVETQTVVTQHLHVHGESHVFLHNQILVVMYYIIVLVDISCTCHAIMFSVNICIEIEKKYITP